MNPLLREQRKRAEKDLGRVAVQVAALVAQPVLGLLEARHGARHQLPEAWPVIHLDEMRHLMRGHIVEYIRRCQYQPPGERQEPARRARTPAGRLVAQCDVASTYAKLTSVPGD